MQSFSINPSLFGLFSLIAIYYLILFLLSLTRRKELEHSLKNLEELIETNSPHVTSLEARRGDSMSQEILVREISSGNMIFSLRDSIVGFTGNHPWTLIFFIPFVIGIGLIVAVILVQFTEIQLNLLTILVLIVFIFAGGELQISPLLRFVKRISLCEYLYPADKEYLQKSLILIKARTKHLGILIILIFGTGLFSDYILTIFLEFSAQIIFSEYFFGAFYFQESSEPDLITILVIFIFAFLLLLLITSLIWILKNFFRYLFKNPLETNLFATEKENETSLDNIRKFYSGLFILRQIFDHFYSFVLISGLILSLVIFFDQIRFFVFNLTSEGLIKILTPTILFFSIWIIFWIVIKTFFNTNIEKSLYKTQPKRFTIVKKPDILRKIFELYDEIKYLDMAELLQLQNEYHLQPWLDNLKDIPGLIRNKNSLKIKYNIAKPFLNQIISNYENFHFIEEVK